MGYWTRIKKTITFLTTVLSSLWRPVITCALYALLVSGLPGTYLKCWQWCRGLPPFKFYYEGLEPCDMNINKTILFKTATIYFLRHKMCFLRLNSTITVLLLQDVPMISLFQNILVPLSSLYSGASQTSWQLPISRRWQNKPNGEHFLAYMVTYFPFIFARAIFYETDMDTL